MTSLQQLKFTLPFPPHILSPNSRKHWRVKTEPKNSMKEAGVVLGLAGRHLASPDATWCVSVAFYPPNLRWDVDGMFSALKSGLDGLAIGLGINDKKFKKFILEVIKADKVNPRVELTLEALNP